MENRSRRVSWSDLQEELIQRIAKCFDIETDVLRSRAVCSSWRSSARPFEKSPLKLPCAITYDEHSFSTYPCPPFNLIERTVYRVQLPENQSPTESKEPNCWLAKVEKSEHGTMRVFNPVSDLQIKEKPGIFLPKVLNTLDFRVSEVCKAYKLQYLNPWQSRRNYKCCQYAKKFVVSRCVDTDEYTMVVIDNENQLLCIKSGAKEWTKLEDGNCCLDVVSYKGQFYVVDLWATWLFDSSFKKKLVAWFTGSSKRRFVESLGELFLVEEVLACNCFDEDIEECDCLISFSPRGRHSVVEIKISKMDNEKKEWVDVKKLDDRILFAGDDCSFSVSAQEFGSCKGTRVFFTDSCRCFVPNNDVKYNFRGFYGHNTGVCDYETGRFGPLLQFPEYADIFWPPPSWLRQS